MIDKRYLLVLLSLASFSGAAQPVDDDDKATFMVGFLGLADQSVYIAGEDKTQVLPYLAIEWGRFYMQGPSIGMYIFEQEKTDLSISIDFQGFGDDDRDKSPQLADMKPLDSVYLASLNYGYKNDLGEFKFSMGYDISGSHDGMKAEVSYGYPVRLGGWMVTPKFTVAWASEEINQFYYGVTAQDVNLGRPLYTPDAGINYKFGVRAMYPLMPRHALMLLANYESYSSDVTDSPIVDEISSMTFGFGYVYRF